MDQPPDIELHLGEGRSRATQPTASVMGRAQNPSGPRSGKNIGSSGGSRILKEAAKDDTSALQLLRESCSENFRRGPPRDVGCPMAIPYFSDQQQHQKIIHDSPEGSHPAVSADERKLSLYQFIQEVYKGTGQGASVEGPTTGGGLYASVFRSHGISISPSTLGSCCDADKGGCKTCGHQELVGEERETGARPKEESDDVTAISPEDRPSGLFPGGAPFRAHNVGIPKARVDPERTADPYRQPVGRNAMEEPPGFPQRASENEEGGGHPQLHSVPESQSKSGCEPRIDCRSGESVRAQTWVKIDSEIYPGPGCAGTKISREDDSALAPSNSAHEPLKVVLKPSVEFEALRKGRAVTKLLGGLPKTPTPLPFGGLQCYGSLPAPQQLHLALPASYARYMLDVEMPKAFIKWPKEMRKGPSGSTGESQQDDGLLRLNPPAVETVRWSVILPFIAEERRDIVECALDPTRFRERVLLPEGDRNPEGQPCRPPRMPHYLQDDMISQGYVYKPRTKIAHQCPVFLVPRPDGRARVIWDGRTLNELCRKPPPFHLRHIGEHIKILLSPKIKLFIVLDMTSWFVQLKPHPSVSSFFGTRLYCDDFIMAGLPMGWAWAPIIAQFSAEGMANCILSRLNFTLLTAVHCLVYIDNIILALEEDAVGSVEAILSAIRKACEDAGAAIKPDSLRVASRVEWLGTEVDALSHQFRIKASFIEKLKKAIAETLPPSEGVSVVLPIRTWFSILSSIIFAVWTRQIDLCTCKGLTSLMSQLSEPIEEPKQWDSLWEMSPEKITLIRYWTNFVVANPWKPLPPQCRDLPQKGVGFSDASSDKIAWAWHGPERMSLSILQNPMKDKSIFFAEFEAMVQGQAELAQEIPREASYLWFADNTGALYISRHGLSKFVECNIALERMFHLREERAIAAKFIYIPSKINPADAPSRAQSTTMVTGPACQLHPGEACSHFLEWVERNTPTGNALPPHPGP